MIYNTQRYVNEKTDNILELLEGEEYNIIFGKLNEAIEESINIRKKGEKTLNVIIRNRILDGHNGQPIPHPTCTVKLHRGNIYDTGLPFEIYPNKIKLYKDANTEENRKLIRKNKKRYKIFKTYSF